MKNLLEKILDCLNKNQLTKALDLCEKNKDKNIEHIILNIKGVVFFKQKKFEFAKFNFNKSKDLKEDFLDPYKNLYQLHLKTKEFEIAIKNIKKIIELEKNQNPISIFNLGLAYDLSKNYSKAIETYKIIEDNNFKEKKLLFNNLGSCYLANNSLLESTKYYLKAFELDQSDKRIINNLALLYLKIGDLNQSNYYLQKAELIDSEFIEFKLNKSDYLFSIDKIKESIDLLTKTIIETKNIFAYLRLSMIYSRIDDNKKSLETINNGLDLYPNSCELKAFKGMLLLKLGNFDEGWQYYEYRNSKSKNFLAETKIWNDESLEGAKILVFNEQGLGDTLQFSINLLELSKIAKKIDFVVSDKLLPIFKKNYQNIEIFKKSEIINNNYDYQISLGSLNKNFFRNKKSDYFNLLLINQKKNNEWKKKIHNKKKNIGLVWSGNFFGPKEPFRSIELKKFEKLLKLNVNFYCLQNEIWERDVGFFKSSNIIDLGKNNFEDIFSIIQNLDLVISTDTSILHLSSISNKETWGLISLDADWRWYDYYKFNPYKNLKIYRQNDFKNWKDVINLIESDLKKKFFNQK